MDELEWLYFPETIQYWTLSEALNWTEESYREVFEAYYGLEGPDAKGLISITVLKTGKAVEHTLTEQHPEALKVYWLAEKLVEGATSLVRPTGLPEKELAFIHDATEDQARFDALIAELEDEFGPIDEIPGGWKLQRPTDLSEARGRLRFLLMCMQLAAARYLVLDPNVLATRMLHLLSAMRHQPGERTRAYLQRTARCYLYRMDAEFAVMARATLEQAIREQIDDAEVKARSGASPSGRIELANCIAACCQKGIFDKAVGAAAERIRQSGNDAVHLSPGLEADSDELLEDLAMSLRALEAAGGLR